MGLWKWAFRPFAPRSFFDFTRSIQKMVYIPTDLWYTILTVFFSSWLYASRGR